MPLELWLAGVVMVSLNLYALGAGADFGGGVWDMLARGPRERAQRETIAHAIGPIWEANHVWLILVIVLLFVAFPVAFAALATALHIPLTLMLIGIVLRGSAFTFRGYGGQDDAVQRRWGRTFAMASVVTPLMLGVCAGAVASGAIRMRGGRVVTDFVSAWLAPFPLSIGLFTLALFAFLAAVYLTLETEDRPLQDDFRRRALLAALAVGAMALVCFLLSSSGAPSIRRGLAREWWSLPFQAVTGLVAAGAIGALWTRRFPLARVLAMAQVTLVLWGWGLAQFPYLIEPDLTFEAAAAPATVLRPLLAALGAGAVVAGPSLLYLYRVFKAR
ncbi:MAG: cytochrome BD ubiquinol oxidase subunit II [Acidobacteria bacterium]|nr:MAG: cytochrome BD ubiquinol oxidase subunit II [Acidobacteriota bacterium]